MQGTVRVIGLSIGGVLGSIAIGKGGLKNGFVANGFGHYIAEYCLYI